jgi:hypothetical protein
MKLHLILLASVFNLSSGFMAELKGLLGQETCTGGEYADFKSCVIQSIATDPNLAGFVDTEDISIMNRGGERKLSCSGCHATAPMGHYCVVMCGSTPSGRRLEEGTDTPNLRRVLQEEVYTAVFQGGEGVVAGAYTGNVEAISILESMITCLDVGSTHHPCLGTTGTMTLTVTL